MLFEVEYKLPFLVWFDAVGSEGLFGFVFDDRVAAEDVCDVFVLDGAVTR
jgi:hypothetical protein